jgi:hypothetical protein
MGSTRLPRKPITLGVVIAVFDARRRLDVLIEHVEAAGATP